jgi:hypothetical protein
VSVFWKGRGGDETGVVGVVVRAVARNAEGVDALGLALVVCFWA